MKKAAFLLALLFPLMSWGQSARQTDYINQYMGMAIQQMQKYKIPASITLAQGLLESAAGASTLARKGNNHFGIKCGLAWKGPYMLMTDDAPNEHFRVYSSAEESYEDHSLFLRQNPRYARLFELNMTDYKGWAHGLKRAGYATNPHYAENLIQLIENFNLNKLDLNVSGYSHQNSLAKEISNVIADHKIFMCNKNFYTFARSGDTFQNLSKELGVSQRKLHKYNEVDKDYVLQEGDIVFLLEKQKKADKSLKGKWHVVQPGESMYSIAQHYGMKLKTLYKINFRDADYAPQAGTLLLIR